MVDKKRVLHIINSLNRGGCELMLLRTLPKLSEFKHYILTLKEPGELFSDFKNQGITVFYTPNLLQCLLLIKKLEPSLIITYLFHADVLGRLVLTPFTRFRVIPFLRTTYNHPRYLVARIFEYFTKYWVKTYYANSQAVKDYYVQKLGVKTQRILVIPNGIDMALYDNVKRDDRFRNQLGIGKKDTVFVCVANYHRNKGIEELLLVFERVNRLQPNTKLILVGKNTQTMPIQKGVILLGARNDIPVILKNSDIFILLTFFEGLSNSILEAMASGLPVITTDIPENKIVITSGYNGILVSLSDNNELENSMLQLIRFPKYRNKIGKIAQKYIGNKYNIKITSTLFSKCMKSKIV